MVVILGCQQNTALNGNSAVVSKSGLKAEAFFPKEVLMVFEVGSKDPVQIQNFANLDKLFPQSVSETLLQSFRSSFNQNYAAGDVDFDKDLLPIFGSNPQILVGLIGDFKENQDFLVAVMINDNAKADKFLTNVVEKQDVEKSSYKGADVYIKTDSFLARYKDVFLGSNKIDLLQQAIDRSKDGNGSLLQNRGYQKALAKIQQPLAFVYMNPAKFSELLNQAVSQETTQQLAFLNNAFGAFDGEMGAVYAEPDGFKISGFVFGKEDSKNESSVKLTDYVAHEPYLYKNIKSENSFLYFESYNLRNVFKLYGEIYKNFEGYEEAVNTIRQGLALQGIDPDKDLLGILDKGVAVNLSAGNTLVPVVDIYLDVSSNPAGANKVVKKIFDSLNQIPDQSVAMRPQADKALFNDKIADSEYVFKVDLTKLPEEQMVGAPKDFLENPLLIKYGVGEDGLMYLKISLGENDPKAKFADDPEFKLAQQFNKDFDKGLFYFYPKALITYMDRWMTLFGPTDPLSPVSLNYNTFKNYLGLVRSVIISYKAHTEKEGLSQIFVHIAK